MSRIVTPPEGPANSALELDDGRIVRLGGAPIPNTVAGKRDNLNMAPLDIPPEPTVGLEDPSYPAAGVEGLTARQDPSMTKEDREEEAKAAEDRFAAFAENPMARVEAHRAAMEEAGGRPIPTQDPAVASGPETDEQRLERLRASAGGPPNSEPAPQPADPAASPPGEVDRRI